ncbi:MAG: glycoside hydrolase family 3 C-terminal domain-containing protein [Anaerolineae bacterium]|nr:glycoside hydrolase family 3 C-terminal domain-containing protein [Anaerolineae bacterium]
MTAYKQTTPQTEAEIDALLARLTLKEKVALLSGKDHWGTVPIPSKGVKRVIVTDGPHGVRIGNEFSDREKSGTATAFPTGVALASTWNPALIREVAVALAEETRANHCDVLLGPCVNLVRVPVAGRNFETYAEDPFLAGKIGAAYVQGLQSRGIGASLKHYACNNQEFERTRGSSNLDERTLRELYLTAFEMIVKEANPWTVMCSYNRINGQHASQNRHLLTGILKEEWGYDGVVVSDWNANHTIFESIAAGLDLEMPGPALYFGKYLEEAVKTWQIDEQVVNQAVRRILRLVKRVEAYKQTQPADQGAFSTPAHRALAQRAASESIVLLKNEQTLLPLKVEEMQKLAVIGPCADKASYTGGGSAFVHCEYSVSPLDGLKALYDDKLEILHVQGCNARVGSDALSNVGVKVTYQGQQGLLEDYYDNREFAGRPVASQVVPAIDYWTIFPPDGIATSNMTVRWSADMQVEKSGRYEFHLRYQGDFEFYIDDQLVMAQAHWQDLPPYPFYTEMKKSFTLEAGQVYSFRLEFRNTLNHDRQAMIVKAEYRFSEAEVAAEIARAVEVAGEADCVLIFAGHPVGYESEDEDRPDLRLPGAQDRLIAAVCAANPRTVVVLNTGAPVEMPWVDQALAIVQAHFFGQEGGHAIAAVLDGRVNPSGKLTTTYPLRYQDNPSYIYYPGNRVHAYGEGVFMGYRYYDFKDIEVLFPFGHGLSYTRFDYSDLQLTGSLAEDNLMASVTIKNAGGVDGAEVVQLYVSDLACSELRPLKELKGFEKVFLKAGEARVVNLPLTQRSFSFFDNYQSRWVLEPGDFDILVGCSSRDIRLRARLEIEEHG